MQRYFANKINDNIILNEDDIFHITKVMRSNKNDLFEIVCNEELYLAKITNLKPFSFEIVEKTNENNELTGYIRLLYCLPKGEKLDLVIQKAVEIGASEIVLVNSSRCVRKITKEEFKKKKDRFNKIIKEASEQCKRTKLMKLSDVIEYKEINKYEADKQFICYEKCGDNASNFKDQLLDIKNKTINVLVGSEGGFSEEEVEYAISNGFKSVSLGKRILRSETSCIYVLSILAFFMELEK